MRADPGAALGAQGGLPDARVEGGRRRVEDRLGTVDRPAGQRLLNDADAVGKPLTTGRDVLAERGERQRVTARPETELEPAAAERIDDGGVLGHSDGVFERQDDDGGAQVDAPGALGDGRQERKRRRQAGTVVQEMMLRDPAAIVAKLLGNGEQLQREAVGVGGVLADVQVGEESESHSRHVLSGLS